MSGKLLIIEDDLEISDLLQTLLEMEGYQVAQESDGQAGLHRANHESFDAIILDIMLPSLDGLEVLRQLRQTQNTPVMMLTARGDDVDRIVGFEIGADDYLPKPFNPRELLARLKALLRRVALDTQASLPGGSDTLVVGALTLNLRTREVTVNSEVVSLTQVEFDLLGILATSPGTVINKSELSEQALKRKLTLYDRAVDVHVSNVRKKLQQAGLAGITIQTVRGIGYVLR